MYKDTGYFLLWGMRSDMQRKTAILLLLSLLYFGGPGPLARAEIIDRMVAVAAGRIITLSDIRKEREIMTVLGDVPGTDNDILQGLIDRYLLEEEFAQFPGLEVSDDDVDERMKVIKDFRGVPESEIRKALVLKFQRRLYLDLRYRQFILASNEEIRTYYETVFVPEVRQRGAEVPELEKVTESIRQNVIEEKLSREVEASMEALRMRSVEIF